MNERILIVDDEADIAKLMQATLQREGYQKIDIAYSLEQGWHAFTRYQPDLVLLDVMLPDGEGYELCKKIRTVSHIPILFMSAKTEELDKILGLAIGGDDYISKPFSPKEVAFRVKAHLRRSSYLQVPKTTVTEQPPLTVGPFEINSDRTEITRNGEALDLTVKELGLLVQFLTNPNRILSKETLFERVWDEAFFGSDNTVMVHIRRLREKIEQDPSQPQYLITVKGLGYKFMLPK